jgi:hypothetical protein
MPEFINPKNNSTTIINDYDILPNLTDEQIDILYLMMIKMDGDHDVFEGSKREYVWTTYLLMKNFLEQSQLMGKDK